MLTHRHHAAKPQADPVTAASNRARRRQAPRAGASRLQQVQMKGTRPAGSLGRARSSRTSSSRCRTSRTTSSEQRECARERRFSACRCVPVLSTFTSFSLENRPIGPKFSSRGSAPHPAGAPAPDPGWGSAPDPARARALDPEIGYPNRHHHTCMV